MRKELLEGRQELGAKVVVLARGTRRRLKNNSQPEARAVKRAKVRLAGRAKIVKKLVLKLLGSWQDEVWEQNLKRVLAMLKLKTSIAVQVLAVLRNNLRLAIIARLRKVGKMLALRLEAVANMHLCASSHFISICMLEP